MVDYKVLMTEIEDTNMEKYPVFVDQKNIAKMFILPKNICIFKAISIKIPMALFTEQVNNPKIWMEWQKTMNGPRSLEEEEKN